MRFFLILGWIALPVIAWAYHLGPGQQMLRLDQTDALLRDAETAVSEGNLQLAKMSYTEALGRLPEERSEDAVSIRLALAKVQMDSGELPEARLALESLVSSLEETPISNTQLVDESRSTLAQSQYLLTWLMRLEGQPAEAWEPEIEAARQNYRFLAQEAQRAGNEEAFARHQHDLEASIRLARMELSELQGLKIPSQCKNCCSQCKKPGKKPAKKKSDKKNSGSNLGPIPEGSGA